MEQFDFNKEDPGTGMTSTCVVRFRSGRELTFPNVSDTSVLDITERLAKGQLIQLVSSACTWLLPFGEVEYVLVNRNPAKPPALVEKRPRQ